jgi:hypothetical protein
LLPSHHLELLILRYVRQITSARWRATTIGELSSSVKCQDRNEIVDALNRLFKDDIIRLRKWIDSIGHVNYDGSTDEFFQQSGFEVEITASGRTYLETLEQREALQGLHEGVSRTPLVVDLDEQSGKSFFPGGGELPNGSLIIESEGTSRLSLITNRGATSSLPFAANVETIDSELAASLLEMPTFMARASALNFDALQGIQRAAAEQFSLHGLVESMPPLQIEHAIFQYQSDLALTIQPITAAFQEVGSQLATEIRIDCQALEDILIAGPDAAVFAPISELALAIENLSANMPKIAVETWPSDVLGARLGLIGHALENVGGWEGLAAGALLGATDSTTLQVPTTVLDIAGQFVIDYDQYIRHLPPSMPRDESDTQRETESRHRDEEVSVRLEKHLESLDPRLLALRRSSWRDLASGDAAGARLAAGGIREMLSEIFRLLAPDDEVKKTAAWLDRSDKSRAKPTRRMRIEYIVGVRASELDALVQFDRSIEYANKFTHTFADDVELVRVALAQIENFAYFLLASSDPSKR